MNTPCIIVASSFVGLLCILFTTCICCYSYKPSINVTPILETITITREHYNTLKNYIQSDNSDLPEYIEEFESPPEYS